MNCPPFSFSLSFWVELIGACNSIQLNLRNCWPVGTCHDSRFLGLTWWPACLAPPPAGLAWPWRLDVKAGLIDRGGAFLWFRCSVGSRFSPSPPRSRRLCSRLLSGGARILELDIPISNKKKASPKLYKIVYR